MFESGSRARCLRPSSCCHPCGKQGLSGDISGLVFPCEWGVADDDQLCNELEVGLHQLLYGGSEDDWAGNNRDNTCWRQGVYREVLQFRQRCQLVGDRGGNCDDHIQAIFLHRLMQIGHSGMDDGDVLDVPRCSTAGGTSCGSVSPGFALNPRQCSCPGI